MRKTNILIWDIWQDVLRGGMRKKEIFQQNEILGELLRTIRKENGLTQAEIANRLGKPQSYISKYETGEKRLDLSEIRSIAQAIGIQLSEIVNRFEIIITQKPQ